MEHLGVSSETIDISRLALLAFQEIGHAPFGIDLPRAGCRILPGRPRAAFPAKHAAT